MHKDLLVKGKFLTGHWDSWLAEILDEPHSNLKGSHMTVSIWLKCMRKTKMLSAASFPSEAHGTAKSFFIVRSWRTWKALNWMLSIKRGYRNILFKLKNPIQSLRPVTALTPQQVWLQWSMVGQNLWSLVLACPQVLFGRHEKDSIPNLDHAAKILNSLLLHHWRSEEGYQYNISKISIWNFFKRNFETEDHLCISITSKCTQILNSAHDNTAATSIDCAILRSLWKMLTIRGLALNTLSFTSGSTTCNNSLSTEDSPKAFWANETSSGFNPLKRKACPPIFCTGDLI